MTDIDRQKLRELCERATPGPWYHRNAFFTDRYNQQLDWLADAPERGQHYKIIIGRSLIYGGADDYAFIAASRTALPALLDLTDAQAAKIAELEALVKDLQVERGELAEHVARSQVKRMHLESERDQLRKQVEGRADWMRRAAEALKPLASLPLWRDHYSDGPDVIDVGQNDLKLYFTVEEIRRARELSAASTLEQKEQG